MTVRLATFNVENLFTRFLFGRSVDKVAASEHGFTADDLRFRLAEPQSKRLTAEIMMAVNADIFALQEVEGLDVLKAFRDKYLGGLDSWPHALVIDGNDQRRIDVGVLSRFPIVHARSWQHLREDGRFVFDRDCLEVDVLTPLGVLTLYINHFKSMRAPDGEQGSGRGLTRARRAQQARAVRRIITDRFGDAGEGAYLVVGDFNDHLQDDEQGDSGIRDLAEWDAVENVVGRMPESERWTHYFSGYKRRGLPPAYRQLDYLLPSRRLADRNPGSPAIERSGQPGRASRFTGKRLSGVGHARPKASDHCPVSFDVQAL